MLVIHWSPVKNTGRILRNGIRKGKHGLYCFPLTGHDCVDRWWAQAFRSWRPRTQYNGFVFRITGDDLPGKFSSWVLDAVGEAPTIQSLEALKAEFRKTILWRIGDRYSRDGGQDPEVLGNALVREDPHLLKRLQADPNWMRWVFEDYQIVLSRSIQAGRILRVVAGAKRSGRERVAKQRTRMDPAF